MAAFHVDEVFIYPQVNSCGIYLYSSNDPHLFKLSFIDIMSRNIYASATSQIPHYRVFYCSFLFSLLSLHWPELTQLFHVNTYDQKVFSICSLGNMTKFMIKIMTERTTFTKQVESQSWNSTILGINPRFTADLKVEEYILLRQKQDLMETSAEFHCFKLVTLQGAKWTPFTSSRLKNH